MNTLDTNIMRLRELNREFLRLMSEGKHEEAGRVLEEMMRMNLHGEDN